tara:strand:- start:141 stop:785 length:645 start_codon:yes stop_codon:yes gene_type:complete
MFQKNQVIYKFLVLLMFGCSNINENSIPYYDSPDFTPHFLNQKQAETRIFHTIPEFTLTDQYNNDFIFSKSKNSLHVANFIFTTCSDICPNMTSNMKLVEKAFFNDSLVKILSFSVTPWIDTPRKLFEYANFYDIKTNNWFLLTGDKSKIYDLARRSYFAEEDFGFSRDSTVFLHTEHFILVDQNRKIRGIYNGTLELETRQLIKDISALKESL